MSTANVTTPAPPATAKQQAILSAKALRKSFRMGTATVEVLKHVDFSVSAGEFVAIEGRSGSGKSTLLHLLGLLDDPEDGRVLYDGVDLAAMSAVAKARARNTQFGFVFQFYYLLPELNVVENTMLAPFVGHSWFSFRSRKRELMDRAKSILNELGLSHRLSHRPAQLSGGERQRVAIARALMNQPRILFADEPTGNLDAETGRQIMSVLEKLHQKQQQTIVMVTHDRTVAYQADRVLVLAEGRLQRAEG